MGRGELWELGLIPVPCGTEGLTVPGLEVLCPAHAGWFWSWFYLHPAQA